ncbi:hypothetical protein [Qaidamihabitans albus]|uniref:hypothetical protein n=1 Tax=Qaidamihabitans albus TaxID=2795733 RepID=UPI0018F21D9C|nr:hypothetical protein [Qaidamihabitans albus]
MRKRAASILTAGAAMGAAVAIAAAPAAAAQQSISVDNPNADGSFEASTNLVVLTDVTTGVSFDCSSSTSSGQIPSGSYTTPADVGDINVAFSGCNGPVGSVTATPADEPYDLVIENFDAATGQSTGYVRDVNVHVSMFGCSFDVTGNAPGVYDNAAGTLTMTSGGTLTPSNVSGCFGLVNNGDELSYEAVYDVTDPATPITVSSP